MSYSNYSNNTTDNISQLPSSFPHPSPIHSNGAPEQYDCEQPAHIVNHINPSQSMGDFSNFEPTQASPSSSSGFANSFGQPTIPHIGELQVQPWCLEQPLEDPFSFQAVHASSIPVNPITFTEPLTSYRPQFLYNPQPIAPLLVTNIHSNSFNPVSSNDFSMPYNVGYDLPGAESQYYPLLDIGSNTMGQGHSSSDFFIVSPPAIPSTEQPFPSNGHFVGDQLDCLHASPCEECTEAQCAYLRFRNPPVDQFGNEVYIGELFTETFNHDSIINPPQSDGAPILNPPTFSLGIPHGEGQANIKPADPSWLQGAQGWRGGKAQKLDSVHTPLVGEAGSILMDPLALQHKRCRFKRKSELPEGLLPGEEQTEAWLRTKEFDGIPSHIPLTLAGLVPHLAPGKDLVARKWVILAILSSQNRALTTEGVLEVLIKMVKRFGDDAGAAIPQGPNKKRTGWAATMLSALSTNTIFVRKFQNGEPSCEWRLDVRGQGFHSNPTKCKHCEHEASNSPHNKSR